MKEREMLDTIISELQERKTENITGFYIAPVSSVADYILLGTATSEPHARAISEYIIDSLKAKNIRPFAVEGEGSRWVCVDFGEVMVHVMCKQEREYYNLEAIWGGCEKIEIQES